MTDSTKKLAKEGRRELKRVARMNKHQALAHMKKMDPILFEHLTAALFIRDGYRVETTVASGDQGVDVLATKNFRKVVIQCKRYDGSVGQPTIRDLYGTMVHNKAAEAYLVTTATVTKHARDWSKGKPIQLIDGFDLVNWIQQSHRRRWSMWLWGGVITAGLLVAGGLWWFNTPPPPPPVEKVPSVYYLPFIVDRQ